MTQRFILDENVVIFAQLEQKKQGEKDSTCLELITRIIRICHTMVADPWLWRQYFHQLNLPRNTEPQLGSRLLRVLTNAAHRADKMETRHQNAPSFPEESSIPPGSQDDVPLVRLSVETGAILVTTDAHLREDLNNCGVQEKYHLRLLSPSEALDEL